MTLEEKAKAYDEAKLRMSAAYNSNRCTISFMNEIFPELQVSEDDRIRKDIIHLVQKSHEQGGYALHKYEADEMLAWLKKQDSQLLDNSAKTCKGEKETTWSEEDEKIRKVLVELISTYLRGNENGKIHGVYAKDILAYLEKQGEQNLIMAKSPQLGEKKPAEWSEEDEKHRLNCLSYFNMIEKTSPYYEDYLWLKSLKDRYTWKPSDEQMNLLEELVEDNNQRHFYTVLKSLYEQLKKLKG